MGLMDAVVGGIGQAAQGVANTTFEAIRAEIQLNQEKALMSWKEELRQKGMAADDAFKNDPERVKRDRQNKVDDETAMGQARVDLNIKNAAAIGASEGTREVEKLKAPGLMAAKKEEARATHIESASSIADSKLKNIQISQLEEANKWRAKATDPKLPQEERDQAKANYQLLAGKDADQWQIVKSKDETGGETVIGRQNTKTGDYEEYKDGTFGKKTPTPEAKPWEKYKGGATGPAAVKSEPKAIPVAQRKTADNITAEDEALRVKRASERKITQEAEAAKKEAERKKKADEMDAFNARFARR